MMKETMQAGEDSTADIPEDAIAIVGMAGRFPGAKNVDSFWTNLREGRESVRFFSREELLQHGVQAELVDDPLYVNASASLDDIEQLDADFFAISPREAEIMDPQHRVFLECASEALENAGHDSDQFSGPIGVFAGAGLSTYLLNHLIRRSEIVHSVGQLQLTLGNNKDYLPLRVSYKLNLKGPSVNVNTACSTSLVAVHMACQSLLNFQCDMALAGGIGIQVPQDIGYLYSPNGIGSPDGHCRAFDRDAQGTVSGNGGGVVVLRRLADALADGDNIHALILASAINNDGAAKVGFTAPSVEGQSKVIMEALTSAQVDVTSITYVEAHGTGTPLGDPIEIAALMQAFGAFTSKTGFCAVGSVKTNIGHLDEGAGVAGLIKTVLALRHREIPPSLNYREPNPAIPFSASPFYVQTRLTPWESHGEPLRAGVSSFGLGGTNAHVVLQEAPPLRTGSSPRPWHLLTVSAKTPSALAAATESLTHHLQANPGINLADLAYTLQVGRKAYSCRKAISVRTVEQAILGLKPAPSAELPNDAPRDIAFLFPGQGSQYSTMGWGLYETEEVFRRHVDHCCELLKPQLGLDLRGILYPSLSTSDVAARNENLLEQTAFAQPALFVVQYALAQLWMSLEVQPKCMLGHSIGEYVAACLAGVFSLQDALALVAARGRLMQRMPPGGMLAVELSEDALRPHLKPGLEIAAINAPTLCVVAGTPPAIEALQNQLSQQSIRHQKLHTSHAFHSEAMDPILGPFLARVRQVRLNPPKIPYLSNLTGDWITAAQATDAGYWQQHLRQAVRFSDGMAALLERPDTVLLEVGPGRTLGSLARRHPAWGPHHTLVQSLRHPYDSKEDAQTLVEAAGQLWLSGACRQVAILYAQEQRQRLELPTYPFERRRYWIAAPVETSAAPEPAQPKLDHWFYQPVWKRRDPKTPRTPSTTRSNWLVFLDASEPANLLLKRLQSLEGPICTVQAGSAFARLSADAYTVNPQNPEDYSSLLAALKSADRAPQTIIHAWNLTPEPGDWEQAQARGLYSLVFLAQAAGRASLPKLSIEVLSNQMQRIGGETQSPLQATLLGAVRVIPKEYPQIECRSIDLSIDPGIDPGIDHARSSEHDVWLDRVLPELLGGYNDPIVALRGNEAWVQDFDPLPLLPASSRPQRLREGGTYLLTGGLGSMGLAFARYLAQEARARLVLVGRRGLPAECEWEKWCNDDSPVTPGVLAGITVSALSAEILAYETRARANTRLYDIEANPRLFGLVNGLCTQWVLRYFAECGLELKPGQVIRHPALREKLQLEPKFERFLDFLLSVLAEDGVIRVDANGIEMLDCALLDRERLDREGLSLDATRAALLEEYGEFRGMVRFLEHCIRQYRPALSGEIPSITVLYPDGTPTLMDECAQSTPRYTQDQVYLATLVSLVVKLARGVDGKPLKILEVGGGAGGLTRQLAPALRGLPVEYHFTDLGGSIVRRAQRDAVSEGLDFMHFSTLDISRDPADQGFDLCSFDLIVGYNVVHASPDLEQSVGHLHALLAPGGMLALVETTRLRRWDELVWGLTEGWWHYTDQDLRAASPLLRLESWERVLQKLGFDTLAYPQDAEARRRGDTGLILGQRAQLLPVAKVREAIETVRACRASGGEVLVLRADVTDLAQLRSAMSQARQRFGPLHGIVHTAGILGQGTIHAKTMPQMHAALAAKIAGTLNLEQVLQEQRCQPDFLMLCSSLASTIPALGQVDYCAANAFLDAYATARHGRGKTDVIAVDWGFWQSLGMIEQANMPEGWKQRITEDIQARGLTGAGVEVFKRVLASCQVPQILVSPIELQQMLRGVVSLNAPSATVQPTHPWLDECLALGDGISAFVAHLSPRHHWVLHEHRPLGQAVLPGTAYLELAFAASQALRPGTPVELNDVYFLSPMIVADDETREVRVLMARRSTGFEFIIASLVGKDAWQEHARGDITYLDPARSAPAVPSPEALAAACGLAAPLPPLSPEELGRDVSVLDATLASDRLEHPPRVPQPQPEESERHSFATRVSGFTPHWKSLKRVVIGEDQALATLHLAPEFATETASLSLHPSLLDMATGFLSMVDGFEAGAPFGYRRVRIWQRLTPQIHSHGQRDRRASADEHSYDLRLLDPQGKLLVEVEGFTLRAYRPSAPAQITSQPENFCVEIDEPGNLGTLSVRAAARPVPGPGEVEVEVAAVGLNFIEVLYSLGMLPEPPGVDRVRFGLECAGTVSALGPGVDGFVVGDRVYGLVQRCVSRYALAPAFALAKVPDFLSFHEAATIPAAYSTAYYALITRARMRPGEKVLIHSAAGGVGLAAVNISLWRGAEIHATAGSAEKRTYLSSLGIEHIADSRSLEFVEQTLAATNGTGVDIVLNSLGGEFIPASLALLTRYGRFLELGKRDIFRNSPLSMAPFERHLSFMAIDVGVDLPAFSILWKQVARAVQRRTFHPLPHRAFPVSQLQEAFEFMAQARHIGKVIVTIGEDALASARPPTVAGGRPLEVLLKPWRQTVTVATKPVRAVATPPSRPEHRRPELKTAYRAASGPAEETILAIWEELLGVSGIGVNDNFFELRGDSLLAAQVTSRLYQAFQVKLPLSSVFEHPTVAELSVRIAQLRGSALNLEIAPTDELAEGEVEHLI